MRAFITLGLMTVLSGALLYTQHAASSSVTGTIESIGKFGNGDGRIVVRVPRGVSIPFVKDARVTVSPADTAPPPPPDPVLPIWGTVDPVVLGTCSVAAHDRYVVDGGDGFLYRTWHPIADPSGCSFAHEHGDDPTTQTNADIRTMRRILFGYAARRMQSAEEPNGHPEAHEGYKVFVANRGQVNDEGRVSLIDGRIVAHMGTSAPRRFILQHHSLDLDIIDSVGKSVSVRMMGDTGPSVTAPSEDPDCVQRPQGGSKAVMTLQPDCTQAPYEIWQIVGDIAGLTNIQASTAAFDPITVRDPNNPLRLLYIWDSAVDFILPFPQNPRDHFRGCEREVYFGPVYWSNTSGQSVVMTDAMGQPSSGPLAIQQFVSLHNTIDFRASERNGEIQNQFKLRTLHCAPSLGAKN